MRVAMYAGTSAALAAAVVMSAFYQRANFYSALVYLSQSNLCLMILVNLVFLVYGSFMYGLQRLCFGTLRPVEVEQLYEKAWFAITETCLAMTVFREEVGAFFIVMFTALITGKVWGWIGEGRVEVFEQQPPANPRLFHARLVVSLLSSIVYNSWLLSYCINTVIAQAKPTMMVMFLFEFAVLAVGSLHTGLRYVISLVEASVVKRQTAQRLEQRRREVREQRAEILRRRQAGEITEDAEPLPEEDDIDEMDIEVPGWDTKGQWILFLDLFADLLKLSVYTAFFCVLLVFYGLPIHIMRDLFMTTRSFVKRLTALMRYKQALRDMNRYPDATAEDLGREDTCIICREEMRPWDPNAGQVERTRPKKLPCGHILHFGCLKSWLERQQVCPTCRSSVVVDQPPRNGQYRPRMAFHIQQNLPGGQNQPAPPNGQAPGGQDAQINGQAGQGGQQQPQGPRAAMRYINLGPIRLGFAQGGQEVAELANRMGVDLNGPNAPAAALANLPAPNPADLSTMEAVRNRLQEVDQRIQQEVREIQQGIQNVHTAQHELQLINMMLMELSRIRQLNLGQQQPATQPGQPTPTPNGAAPIPAPATGVPSGQAGAAPVPPPVAYPAGQIPLPTMPQASNPFIPRMNSPTVTRHGAMPQQTAIPSGSADLPEGVVIPPGWSLMPLQRLDGGGIPANITQMHGGATPSHPPEGAQQAGNGQPNGAMPPQSSSSIGGAASGVNGGTTSEDIHGTTAQQAPRQSTAEPPHVAAPTPVTPVWGGPAQLFGGDRGGGGSLPFGLEQRVGSSRSASQTREGENDSTTQEGGERGVVSALGGEPSTSAAAAAAPSPALPTEEHGDASSSTAAKGKAPAATVEDTED
ncbi:E3 ubiquitin-protein ligase synoviolin [Diaporthe helianthi]|uniref:RING-type E3 ubiquitin transferase n=1 Tax=Diaporthe helianthi TaxID=158607 RepID=A0A2P5I804_DIAHE|nr:E3 ubiquitin-protein ligase synoviolin [Diaporthe helianthi]